MSGRLITILALVGAAAVALSSLPGCAAAPSQSRPGAAVILTDQLGRQVSLPGIPQRIISMAPDLTETLFALGIGDRVVGVTDYCDYPPEAKLKEKIGGFSTPDLEKITALSPDLVFAANIHVKKTIPDLEARGFKVLALTPGDVEGVLEAILLAGRATGAQKEAESLEASMRRKLNGIVAATSRVAKKPRVFYITWHDPLWTTGSGTIVDDLINKAGGINLTASLSKWQTVGLETVIGGNPQVIIAGTGHGSSSSQTLEWAKSEPRLASTEARKNGRVHQVDSNLVTRTGSRIVDGLEEFARLVHPGLLP